MEIRVLQYFLAVAEAENITAAAESMHLSQPNLSRQLKDLEEELGKPLLIRGKRKVTLTDDGVILKKRAEEVMALLEKASREIRLSDYSISGDIYIGAGETSGLHLLAKAAKQFSESYPSIHYSLISGNANDLLDKLDKGLIDFAVIHSTPDPGKYVCLPLPYHDLWGVLMLKSAPLAKLDSIRPEDLYSQPLILPNSYYKRGVLGNWLKKKPSQLHVTASYNLLYNASILVRENLGYALCIDKLIDGSDSSSLCFRPLEPRFELPLYIVWKKYQVFSKASEKFLKFLEQQMESFSLDSNIDLME